MGCPGLGAVCNHIRILDRFSQYWQTVQGLHSKFISNHYSFTDQPRFCFKDKGSFVLASISTSNELSINSAFFPSRQITYSQHSNVARRVCSLFANIKVLLFLFGCVSFGICIGIVWQFLFW